mgnify:CR=1 FL=1
MKNNSIYKKQYLLFLILLFSFYTNLAKAVENKPSLGFKNEKILTYLQENNIIKGSVQSKQARTINSNSNIIFVETQEGNENFSYAIKIYSTVNVLPIERSLTKYFEKKKQEYKDKIISIFGEEDGNSFIKALLIDQPEACKIRAIDYSL